MMTNPTPRRELAERLRALKESDWYLGKDRLLFMPPNLRNDILAALDQAKAMQAEIEALRERGAQAVIAYHLAICSPKGVVPVDSLYDPVLAARTEREMSKARAALAGEKE